MRWTEQKYIDRITITFLVKGHTENSADTVHLVIERNKKIVKLFLPNEWATITRSVPTEKIELQVHEMEGLGITIQELSLRLLWRKSG